MPPDKLSSSKFQLASFFLRNFNRDAGFDARRLSSWFWIRVSSAECIPKAGNEGRLLMSCRGIPSSIGNPELFCSLSSWGVRRDDRLMTGTRTDSPSLLVLAVDGRRVSCRKEQSSDTVDISLSCVERHGDAWPSYESSEASCSCDLLANILSCDETDIRLSCDDTEVRLPCDEEDNRLIFDLVGDPSIESLDFRRCWWSSATIDGLRLLLFLGQMTSLIAFTSPTKIGSDYYIYLMLAITHREYTNVYALCYNWLWEVIFKIFQPWVSYFIAAGKRLILWWAIRSKCLLGCVL